MDKLSIGDKVIWRGGFGHDEPKEAVVKSIEVTDGGKYGMSVSNVDWSEVNGRNVVVDLDNGSWAYGSQIRPCHG